MYGTSLAQHSFLTPQKLPHEACLCIGELIMRTRGRQGQVCLHRGIGEEGQGSFLT